MRPVGGDENTDVAGESAIPDDPQPSAFESLLRQVARAPPEESLSKSEELGPGVVVAGRFELIREIGRGGFARVFEARDRVLSRPVAIKFLKRRRRLNDSELDLFYREARATARLNHPHIVTVYDWGVWNEAPFLVLELLDGESLQAHLAPGLLDEDRSLTCAGALSWLMPTRTTLFRSGLRRPFRLSRLTSEEPSPIEDQRRSAWMER